MLDAAKTAIEPWSIKGELILNCNCTVFCPCVVSLGAHPPTQGTCKAWLGVRIDEGKWGATDLSGLNVAMMLDIPGSMSEGDWKAAGYFDDRADDAQFAALELIFSGRARGTTGLFRLLVSEYLGSIREEIRFTTEGNVRHLTVGRRIQGAIAPVEGADPGQDLKVTNTKYWMGPDVTIAQALKGKVRDFGRVWNLDGKSAEICQIDWTGP
ncbi:DUF1326 domain-containing protein [Limibaculum sp. FT325]|uniref:DUF1326 domain-containing protein n=1 Tax=Thermohalobaculum sediminis TaxID=2939436 RepID=UPI0020C069C2|nr:DUF1326 domain-containing protein [Limibaculum sediminis]MCL5777915.1 DUF1326 domain-containing protein [Limibaculum sediminis]